MFKGKIQRYIHETQLFYSIQLFIASPMIHPAAQHQT